jgi:ethanolamine ammonia-lyase small subunit
MSAPLSRTRALVAALRARLGESAPLPPPAAPQPIAAPPARIFVPPARRSAFAAKAAEHTTALVGIGNVGTRYPTDVVLQFQAELAVAHAAVAAELPDGFAERHGCLGLQSRVREHREFLLRPDLGRRLDEASIAKLQSCKRGIDVQPILADGLSAIAAQGAGPELLQSFSRACERLGLTVGTPLVAKYARVWLQDEIGDVVQAKVSAILLGERPGLGTGDGLSAYLVFGPKLGRTDSDRNMMSNIHARGTPPAEAPERLARLAQAMIVQGCSGVALDLAKIGADGASFSGGYRAPEPRVRLVETDR